MTKYKALYQAMYDDLKDADMMIGYACKIKWENPEDKGIADEFAKYAKFRLDHYMSFCKMFDAEYQKEKKDEKSAPVCLWEETWNHMQDWYEKIHKEIERY